MPTSDTSSCLNTPDADPFSASLPLGGVAPDGPITVSGQLDWWLGQLSGQFVVALFCNADIPATAALREITALLQDSPLNAKLVLVLSPAQEQDRQSVVSGKSASVRVDLGGRRTMNKKQLHNSNQYNASVKT